MGLNNELFFKPPSPDEIEITLIGTGGGYGEAVVVKLNTNVWAIIDSCINPSTKKPLTIEYLENIGVDVSKEVKYVICTHWHDDHIRGLSTVLEKCKEAKFCMPSVNDKAKFLTYVNLEYEKARKGSLSSLKEFKDCLRIVQERLKQPKRLKIDLAIYQADFEFQKESSCKIELYALSPSEAVITHFDKELSDLINNFDLSKKSIPEKSANEKSSVLLFKYGSFSAILGADLEVSSKLDEGWFDILNNSEVRKGKSIIYKIPHHGSSNGYNQDIYENLFEQNAILKLSPWNRRNKLPEAEMLDKYKKHSKEIFITSHVKIANNSKKRDKNTNKLIKLFSRKLNEIKFDEGIVRTRHSLLEGSQPITETYGSAFKIE